jgi:integrase
MLASAKSGADYSRDVHAQQRDRQFPRPTPPATHKEPEPFRQGSGSKGITRRSTVGGALAYYVSAKTKTEARRALRQAMADADRGLIIDADSLKVGENLDRWLADSVSDTVKATIFERYEQITRLHLKPALGRVNLKALTPAHVRSLYREKLEAGSSARTVRYIHTTLHKALKQAVMDGLIPRNATEAVKPPQTSREEMHPLTPEQSKHLLQVAHEVGGRLEALYVLAIHIGLRQGELLGLKWEDVDLDDGSLRSGGC